MATGRCARAWCSLSRYECLPSTYLQVASLGSECASLRSQVEAAKAAEVRPTR
jgi:hypothetical protein